mmetsp:Transcript_29474/g.68195  ORF Transcript_29474/g.68195 Transcript_29474/m.68195 type:complete len:200 (-) Transcript_29474:107-706(-)
MSHRQPLPWAFSSHGAHPKESTPFGDFSTISSGPTDKRSTETSPAGAHPKKPRKNQRFSFSPAHRARSKIAEAPQIVGPLWVFFPRTKQFCVCRPNREPFGTVTSDACHSWSIPCQSVRQTMRLLLQSRHIPLFCVDDSQGNTAFSHKMPKPRCGEWRDKIDHVCSSDQGTQVWGLVSSRGSRKHEGALEIERNGIHCV